MKDEQLESRCLSRRELLAKAGKLTAMGGLVMASAGGLGMQAGCADGGSTTTNAAGKQGAKIPWPYANLNASDIKQMQETAHDEWFVGFCAFATFSGIISRLREKVGEPYASFPMEVITFAHGGTAGWGGTCGTLIGAGLAAALAAGPKDGEAILNEVMKWYSETELPIYMPDKPKAVINTVSRSDSPLCHVSVDKWMKKEGVGFLSPQQMERCARLSADVAAKTAEYLNSWSDEAFVALNKSPVANNSVPSQYNCRECHGTNIPPVPKPGGGESLLQAAQ